MTAHANRCAAVAFKKIGGAYRGSVALRDLPQVRGDPAETMRAVADIYRDSLAEIKRWRRDVGRMRETKTPLPARKAWQLGDILHRLHARLRRHGCKLQSLYDHLQRHAGLPPKRAAEFFALRKYVANERAIPETMTWNSIVKNIKSGGEQITAAYWRTTHHE